ncbi:MAG: dipeptide/oligopeptide/nickel ABC transporter ATP-binding protein [bacterium]|nr:dipeptide/oligopeptide/nickel ABC transporter ATP-binding protein [bacterium]
MANLLLEVDKLSRFFPKEGKGRGFWRKTESVAVVKQVSFSMHEGEILALLGESGCGKSTIAKMLLGLLKPTEGSIFYQGKEVSGLSDAAYRPYRREIQMIFQNPFSGLDARKNIRSQLLEPLRVWKIGANHAERMERIEEICQDCGLPKSCLEKMPAEFSGGQLQRIAIARALLLSPKFLVADEIVSALDVPIQNQILDLLQKMQQKYGLTVLFITHDIAVAKHISDRMMLMRSGEVLGIGKYEDLLQRSEESGNYLRELQKASFVFGKAVL